MSWYVDRFLNLKCSGDILNIVNPLTKPMKEISESMGIIKLIKPIVLEDPMKYILYDLCAGNALTSIIASFLLPVARSIAVDVKMRKRPFEKVERFEYWERDINMWKLFVYDYHTIIISVHPCGKLAERIIDIFLNDKAEYLFLMPCCINNRRMKDNFLVDEFGKEIDWIYYLKNKLEGNNVCVEVIRDTNIISPRNIIIKGRRKDKEE